MKKVYLAILSLLAIAAPGLAQTTVTINCTGTTGSFNSGYVTSAGVKTDGNIIADGVTTLRRGWTTFDLSSIPAGSLVNSVTLKFTVTSNNAASGVTNQIYGFAGTPSATAGTTLYANCASGTAFYNNTWTQNTTNSIAFNAVGITFISGALGGNANIGLVRGAGSSIFNINGYPTSPQPQLVINYSPTYKAQFTALNTGAATWCAGETRNVLVTVKNTGTSAWTSNASTGVNFSYWWTPGQNRDFNMRILPFANLLPNASQTISIPITAPASGPLVLNFDLVKEGSCWFADNTAGCSGPGNSVFQSTSITINALPASPTGTTPQVFCTITTPSPTVANLAATGTTIKWYSTSSGGTALATSTPIISGTHYYASQTNASGCESATRFDVTATITNPSAPTGTSPQSFCAINNPTIANLIITATAPKWYTAATGGTPLATTTPLVNGVTYYASQTTSGCESATRLAITATVGNPIAPGGTAAQSFCMINTPTVANLAATGTAIQWYSAATGGTALVSTTSLVNGTHYYASQTVSGCESAARLDVTASVGNPAAPIGTTPQLFCSTDNPTMANVTATGSGIQWYNAPTGGTLLANTTPLVSNSHYYASQTVSGCESATRLNILVTVNPAIVISTQPAGPQTICASSPVTFSVTATGGVAYQWYLGTTALVDDGNTTGSQTATLKILEVNPTDAGLYHVVVSGNAPCGDVTSADAQLIVNETISFTTQPAASQTLCVGGTAIFTGVATGTGITYLWRKGTTFLTDGGNISGSGTNILTLSNITAADAGTYSVQASDGTSGCPNRFSANAVLNITPTSVGGTVNNSASVCSGTNGATLTLSGKTGVVQNWEYSIDGGANYIAIANATTSQAYLNLTQTTLYRAVVVNGVCASSNSVPATITINELPTITPAATAADVCFSTTAQTTTLAYSATTNAPTTYSITWSGTFAAVNNAALNPGTITINVPANAAPGTYTGTLTVKNANGCISGSGTNFTVTILANSVLTRTSAAATTSQTVCINTPVTNITYSVTAGGTGASITAGALPAGVTGTFSGGTFTISGTPTVSGTFSYTITSSGPCVNPSLSGTITVNADATIALTSLTATTNQTVCINNPVTNITYSIGGLGATGAVLTGQPAGITGTYNGVTKIFTITGTPTASGTFNYTVTTTGPCVNTSLGGTITVQPNSTLTLASGAATQTVCINTGITTTTYAIGGSASGASLTSGSFPAGVTGTFAGGVFTIAGSPTVSGSFPYTITTTGPCTNTSVNGMITINVIGSWLGGTSANWFTASNWGCGVIPTATTDVIIPASGVTFQPGIGAAGAVCRNITINGSLTMSGAFNLDVNGDWTNNGTFTPSTSTITFKGGSNNSMAGTSATTFYNLIVNKTATATTLTSATNAFTTTNLTITQGDLILTANVGNSYVVNADINVPAAGILTDNVNWDGTHLLSVGGNIFIDGIFNYNTAIALPHVTMVGAGTKTVRTGANAASGFGFLTLQTGNYSASGPLVINSNFWAMFGTTAGSFSTAGQTVTAKASLLIHGGIVNINGGTLNVTGGMTVGYPGGLSGIVNFSSGTLNADAVTVGPNTPAVNGVFNQTGGIANIGDLLINNTTTASSYICTGSPVINITGNWTNNETFTPATSQVNFNGSTNQTIGGSTATTFNNLSIANGAGVTLSTNATVNATLNLSNGLVSTGTTNVITVATAGTITGGSVSSYVNGKLARGFATGAGSKIFPIGKGGNYKPLTFAYITSGAASTITAEQFESAIPGTITPASVTKDVRYWEITKAGTGTVNYTVTLDPSYTPAPAGTIVQIIKREGTSAALTATAATAPNYTNGTAFTTFNNSTTASGVNDFSLGSDCSSSAIAGASAAAICQGGTTAGLGGAISGTATGAIWSTTAGGTFNPNATTLNATWTPPAGFSGTATLVLTPTGGLCTPSTADSKTQVVNPLPTIVTVASTGFLSAGSYLNCGRATLTASNGSSGTMYFQGTTSGGTSTATPAVSQVVTTTGTYYFRAQSAAGCWGPEGSVNITILPIPAAVTVSGGGTYCGSTTITASNGADGTIYFQGTTAGGTSTATAATSRVITVSGTYYFRAQSASGCWSPEGSTIVTINPFPTGSLAATETSGSANNDGIICTGDNVQFTATPSGLGSYIFKVNGVIKQSGTTNVFNSNTLAPGASVTVDIANSFNCGITLGPVAITVNPLPTPTLIADKTSICPGDNVTFTAGGGASYNFKVNGSSAQSSASSTFSTTTLNNNDNVTVEVTNTNGCIATYTPSIVITVNSLPSGTLNSTSSIICAGDNVTFTALPAGLASYNFKINGTSVQNNGSNIFSSTTLTNPSVVTVDVTNASGCAATFGPKAITVNPLPTGTIVATENSGVINDNSICAGAPVTFTATSGFSDYKFYLNGTGASLQSGSSNIYNNTTLVNGDYITVVVTTGSGCKATFTSATILVAGLPLGSLSVSPSATICAGDNVVFTATAGFANYLFILNGSTVLQNGPGNTFSSTGLVNGDVVTVDVTNSNSCFSTFGPVTMIVSALPGGTLAISENSGLTPNDGIICAGASVIFTAPTGWANYNFFLNGTSIQSTASNIYTSSSLADGDQVTVDETNAGGCTGSLNTWTITVKSLPVVAAPGGGAATVCVNSVTPPFTDATPSGVWSVTNGTGTASITPAGVVTGLTAGIVTINYTITNSFGCTATAGTPVTVNALPVVAPVTGTAGVCVAGTTQLNDVTSGGTWGTSDGTVATVNGSGLVTGMAAGTATISYTVTNGSGCTQIASLAVTVNPLPVVQPITGTTSVCAGSTTPLADATGSGTWGTSDGAIATVNASTGVVTGVSGGTAVISYGVTVGGCTTTVTTNITVNALPVPTLSGPGSICLGSINNLYTTESGQSNYIWNVVNGTVTSGGTSTDNTITISWLNPGVKSINVNYTDINGCSGASSATVVNAPGSTPTITGPTTVCQNSTGNLYTTETGKTNYAWAVNGGTITSGGAITDNTATITWDVAGAKSITVNYAAISGCDAATATVYNVTVNPQPLVVTHDPLSLCSPATADLTAAAVTAGSTAGLIYTYWTDAAATLSYSTPATASAGTYYIKGTTVAGCSDIQAVTVTVNPTPTVVITNPGQVCSPATVDLTQSAVTSGSTAGLTFTYFTDAAGTVVYSTPATAGAGTYYIKGSTAAGCYDIKPVTVTVNPQPTVVINNPSGVCTLSTVDLTAPAVTSGSTAGLTFTYFTDAAGTTVYSSPTTAGAGTYYIKGTTAAGCSDIKPVTVTVNPSPTVVINNPTALCTPSTADLTQAAVTSGSTAGLTFTYWTNAAATTSYSTPATSGAGTYYIKGTTAGGCSDIKPVTVTVNPSPAVVITNPAGVCSPSTVNLTATAITTGSTAGLTYTYWTNAAATIAYPTLTTAGAGTYYIKGTTGLGCFDIKPVVVTVNPLPTVVVTNPAAVCTPSTVDITASTVTTGSTAGLIYTYWTNAAATTSYPTPTTAGAGTYYIKGTTAAGCFDIKPVTVTVNALPVTPTITPATATICQGGILPLSSGTLPSTLTTTLSSGPLTLIVPDNDPIGAANTIAIAGIPAGAIVNSVSIKFNIAMTYDGDLRLNLKAPNGNVLNIVNTRGGAGANFTNTIVSSNGITSIVVGSAPFNNTYKAEGLNNAVGATIVPGNKANVTTFASLFSTPNGNWTFSAVDLGGGDVATITDWTITVNYTTLAAAQAVTWSPITDLYTDAGATTAYAGQSLAVVYAKPATPGTKVYTATATNAANCTSSANATLTVNPVPVVTIFADYCVVAGKVRLTATSTPAGATYIWSTGQTGAIVDVDIADDYTVVASFGTGCSTTSTISVAKELVVNGDFTNGNTGFTSDYAYKADIAAYNQELVDDTGINGYGVGTDGQNYHPTFYGLDHTNNTTGARNYMLVNGHGNVLNIWKETVSVLPNTTYYFSAWGMSINNVGPFARLQFNINGAQVGTIDTLVTGVNNNTNNGWTRFYGTLVTGPTTTTAVISITDLEPAAGGNDFGLDDISFATLSTFVQLVSPPGTDAQTPCINTPITPIVYSVGSTASGPIVTGLPAGVTSSFNGVLFTISGTPTVSGNFTYTITTTGTCNPSTATGTIKIQGQKITLSSGSASPLVCVNSPVNIGFTLGGTATGASTTGLPPGVTGTLSGTAYTLAGTPTTAGVYPYTITTAGTCTAVTFSGTITVQSQTVTLSSPSSSQTVCINSPITNIQFTVDGTGTGASVTGLPPGVTGTYNTGLFIISGTPTSGAGSPYTYTVTTTGTCGSATATGIITITPAASLTLTSGSGTNPQTACSNAPIVPVTYSVNNATGASITSGALPAGVTGNFSGGVFTISGTPTAGGIFNYTITTTGGCASASVTGTITVQAQTVTLTSGIASPTLCLNTSMANIVYTIGGTATAATVSGLPAGVSGLLSSTTFTISGTPTSSGTFPYTITTSGGCGLATATGTITVSPAAIGGTVSSTSICSGASGTLTLSGQVGIIQRWEVSTNGGSTWIILPPNTTNIQSYTGITQPTMYRVAVTRNGCSVVYSAVGVVSIYNLWTGGTSTDWNTASNWSANIVPSVTCPDVYIPSATPNQPTLSSGPIATINNLHIFPGATLTINSGTLQIAGTISNAGTFIALNGTVEFNGSAPQTIPVGVFQNNALNNLIVSNTSATGVTVGGALDIYGSLTYGPAGTNLNTNDSVTLKSTATATASLGNMTGHTISGNVTVERYIGTGAHPKSWQLLAIPTQGQTIKAAWQEGATATNVALHAPGSAGNPKSGYGTMLTSDVANATAQPFPGFDALTTPGPSIKVYNSALDNYIGPASTGISIYNKKGYFVLVRGDRSVYTSGGSAVPTVLRTTGTLFTPANLPPTTTVFAGKSESVGNPYASAIDLRKLTLDAGTNSTIIVWDPTLGGSYGLGGYQTLYLNGDGTNNGTNNYINLLTSTAYGPVGTANNNIQSGQAFIIQALPAVNGNISFAENAKVSGSKLLQRQQAPAEARQAQLRVNLYSVSTGSTYLADGTLIQYNDNYSNSLDGMDARKMINTGENLGIKTEGKLLAIERRHTITRQDTIFLNLSGVRVQAYRFELIATNLNTGLQGFLEDTYLHTKTSLDLTGTTLSDFSIVNIAGSYASNRFRIVFAPTVVLPVTFTSVKAYRQDKNIAVEWSVENEMNMKQYEVEKSTDGNNFTTLTVKAASANGGRSAIYVIQDGKPAEGYNYYRVKSVDINGKMEYTNVVKVLMGSIKQDINIYPNPITDGMIHLQLLNQPGGKYGIRLLNKVGQVILSKQITHAEGNGTELIKWDFNLAHGMYQLEVTKPDGSVKDINVLY